MCLLFFQAAKTPESQKGLWKWSIVFQLFLYLKMLRENFGQEKKQLHVLTEQNLLF